MEPVFQVPAQFDNARWKSRHVGRPPLPKNLRVLIVLMAQENPSWGEGRIADELSLKLGLLVDSRTVGKYLKQSGRPRQPSGQRWSTFIRNHAKEIIACDFFTSVRVTFQVWHVLSRSKLVRVGFYTAT